VRVCNRDEHFPVLSELDSVSRSILVEDCSLDEMLLSRRLKGGAETASGSSVRPHHLQLRQIVIGHHPEKSLPLP
jgi:hypothetical protein